MKYFLSIWWKQIWCEHEWHWEKYPCAIAKLCSKCDKAKVFFTKP